MSNNKGIFPNILKDQKIFRELLKSLTGRDPGHLEHLLLSGRTEETYDTSLRIETSLNVDYSIFEDDNFNLYTIGIFYEPMYPKGYLGFLNSITADCIKTKYGDCSPLLSHTVVGLVRFPNVVEHCEENEFLIDMCKEQEDPAIMEMLRVLYVDEYEPVTELGKATKEYIISIWGENYWKPEYPCSIAPGNPECNFE